jgi:hypothetical protein
MRTSSDIESGVLVETLLNVDSQLHDFGWKKKVETADSQALDVCDTVLLSSTTQVPNGSLTVNDNEETGKTSDASFFIVVAVITARDK